MWLSSFDAQDLVLGHPALEAFINSIVACKSIIVLWLIGVTTTFYSSCRLEAFGGKQLRTPAWQRSSVARIGDTPPAVGLPPTLPLDLIHSSHQLTRRQLRCQSKPGLVKQG